MTAARGKRRKKRKDTAEEDTQGRAEARRFTGREKRNNHKALIA
jgi:hypothetical protein